VDQRGGERGERQTGWKLSLLSCGLAVAGALAMLFLPLGRSESVTAVLPGEPHPAPKVRSVSLFETEGWYAVALAAIPVALSAVTLPFRGGRNARWVRGGAAVLLTAFVVLGLPSLGLFFLPAAGAMWAATFL
jgi:hypothetical protein